MSERLFGALGLGRQKAPKETLEKPELKEADLSIEIGNSTYLLSREAQKYLERAEASDYPKSRSILIISEPHHCIEAQFNLYKGLEIFFRDNPALVERTIFLAEGFPANQPVPVQSLIDEEPDPSDELVREVLESFLITGYVAYEWKHQNGIPIFGTEDEWFYDMGMTFATALAEDPGATSGTMTSKRGKTVDIKVINQWIFSIVIRNKSIAGALIGNAENYENPMLFVGKGHLDRMPDTEFHQMKNLADIPIFGPFGPYATAIAGKAENFGLYDYLMREKIGFTLLNPVGIGSEEASEIDAYLALFKTQREVIRKGQTGEYEKYLELFLAQRSSRRGTTVKPSPEVAAELVKRLKDRQKSSGVQKSGIIYERSDGGSGERDNERGGAEQENWFKISRDELRKTIGKDTIWGQAPMEQGLDFEKLRRANLGSNCPYIDDIVIDAMTATQHKTMDLTLKSYQDVGGIDSTVERYIDDLSGFTELKWTNRKTGVHYDLQRGRDFQDRYLELGIPLGRATQAQINKLVELQEYAQTKDVTLVIVEVP